LLAGTRDSLQFRVVDNSSLGSRIRHLMVDRQRRIWALGLSTGGTTMRLGCYRLTLATGIDGPLFALEKQVWNLTTLAGIEQAAFATPPSSIAHPWNAEPRISLQIKAVNRPWTHTAHGPRGNSKDRCASRPSHRRQQRLPAHDNRCTDR
jgi:hypothetical protein